MESGSGRRGTFRSLLALNGRSVFLGLDGVNQKRPVSATWEVGNKVRKNVFPICEWQPVSASPPSRKAGPRGFGRCINTFFARLSAENRKKKREALVTSRFFLVALSGFEPEFQP